MNVSKALYSDLRAARQARTDAKKPYEVTRLTNKGAPSKMPADTARFSTVEEAQAYMDRIVCLNPYRYIRFTTNFQLKAGKETQP